VDSRDGTALLSWKLQEIKINDEYGVGAQKSHIKASQFKNRFVSFFL
jgi:hypothetical protein